MIQPGPCEPGQLEVERLLEQSKHEDALALLTKLLNQDPHNRESRLYFLLANVQASGPEAHEQEIDNLRSIPDLSDHEREIIRRIFLLGYQAAEREGQEDKMIAYQRLLRRLILAQPLTQSIPISTKPIVRRSHENDLSLRLKLRLALVDQLSKWISTICAPEQTGVSWNTVRLLAVVIGALAILTTPIIFTISRTGHPLTRETNETGV